MGDCSKCNGTGRGHAPSPYGWRLSTSDVWLSNWGICPHCNGSGREPEDHTVRVAIYRYDIHAS